MNNFGKIMAVVLVVLCSSAVISIQGIDAEPTAEPTPIDAGDFLALTDSGKIVLTDDYKLSNALVIIDDLIIDLNGHRMVNGTTDHTISVKDGASLTIIDSIGSGKVDNTVNKKAALAIWPGASAVLKGGIFDRSAETGESIDISGGNSWYTIKNQGTLIIDGAEVRNTGSFSSCIASGWYDATAKTAGNNDLEAYAGNNAVLRIISGTISGGINSVKNDDAGELYISGGSMTNTTQATIFNCNIAEISGGYFQSEKNVLLNRWYDDTLDIGRITVTGGVFKSANGVSCAAYADKTDPQKAVFDITGGLFSDIDDSLIAEGYAAYICDNGKYVHGDIVDAGMIVEGIPFSDVSDLIGYLNILRDVVDDDNGKLKLKADVRISSMDVLFGKKITVDLNGFDLSVDTVKVVGILDVMDSIGDGRFVTDCIRLEGGSITGSGTIAGTKNTTNLIQIISGGSVSGITADITDIRSNGGAIANHSGFSGSAVVQNVTILIRNADVDIDRGIYIDQMREGSSFAIHNVKFDFNGNDACPINADVDGKSNITIFRPVFDDCTRSNKVLINSMGDVTIGDKGNLKLIDVKDVALWDASDSGKSFIVAGQFVSNGRISVVTNGNLVIPKDAQMIVNSVMELTSDSTISGKLIFGNDAQNSIVLDGVIAGETGFRTELGSVVMSGSIDSGNITLSGIGKVDGVLNLGSSTVTVPKGSVLNVLRDSKIIGDSESKVIVDGKANVYGSMESPVKNNGSVYTIGNGKVTGELTGNEVQEKKDEDLRIEFIPDMNWMVDETKSITIGLHPIDAVITGITGADWLKFDGNIIRGTPTETGTYNIKLTASLDAETSDGQAVFDEFTITVTDAPVEEEDSGFSIDWKLVIGIVFVVIVAILILRAHI